MPAHQQLDSPANQHEQDRRPLPDGWRWVRLGDVGHFESGGTPSKDIAAYWGGNIPFVTGADVTELHITAKHARAFLTDAGLTSGKTAVCHPGTVLFVTRTRVGRVGIATETMGASQDLSPYVCGPNIDAEYVCRYLLSISDVLLANCRGSTIQGLTRDFVHSLDIPLPPLSEQQRIAALLTEQMAAVERARAAAAAQLEAARELPAAYLRVVFESEEARGWPRVRLGDVGDFIYGSSLPAQNRQQGSVPVYGSNGIVGFHDRAVTNGPTIVVGRKGSIGEVQYSPIPCWPIDTTYFIERPKVPCDLTWLMYLLRSLNLQTLNKAAAVPGLSREDAYGQRVPLPPLSEQQRIAALLTEQMAAVERARAALQAQLEAITALPGALLARAFSGAV